MTYLQIQLLTVDEFKSIVNEIVSLQLKEHLKKEEDPSKFITRKEAAKILSCSLNTLDSWIKRDYLKVTRYGSSIRLLKSEVELGNRTIIRKRKKGEDYD